MICSQQAAISDPNFGLQQLQLTNNMLTESQVPLNSDLVSGVYEGGLKVWECSIDICNYLCKPEHREFLKGKRVLELGCG
jgi:hypothetical protein